MNAAMEAPVELAGSVPAQFGESPLWHVEEQCLYYIDIAARQVLRLHPESGVVDHWQLDAEPGCIARMRDGGLLVARRDGLWRLDTSTGEQQLLSPPPYDPSRQRFNDGKPDARGRFWVGTIDDARQPQASLYRYEAGRGERVAGGIANSNGLAFSPDGRRLYWADTKGHQVWAFDDIDPVAGMLGTRSLFASFAPPQPGQPQESYGGRPDGAAVDVDGCYWVAMHEGQRLLCLSPQGELLREVRLPVRCPTMLCFGGADLRTIYVTTARKGRPELELAAQPWAGCVLRLRVEVPGLPADLVAW
jgi:sugar lactone lactonase YvrE